MNSLTEFEMQEYSSQYFEDAPLTAESLSQIFERDMRRYSNSLTEEQEAGIY